MKKPLTPPKFDMGKALTALSEEIKVQMSSVAKGGGATKRLEQWSSPVADGGKYIHWDNLWHKLQPDNTAVERQWNALKLARTTNRRILPLSAARGKRFWFCQKLDDLARFYHWLDKRAAGVLGAAEPDVFDEKRHRRFLMDRAQEEAINSSILEGAATTRAVAREILSRKNPKPRSHGEKMIVNNYYAMLFIDEIKGKDLSISVIFELHRILTEDTMKPDESGRLRAAADDIVVKDSVDNSILHRPPPASETEKRLQELCDFANGEASSEEFLHPVIRAIAMHFMIGYIHPFVDGNGRTARALFYWAMARSGYWVVQYVSISEIVLRAQRDYKRAFLLTETDDDDLTYFLLHQMHVVKKAFARLEQYVEKEYARMRDDKWGDDMRGVLNRRQIMLLNRAAENPMRFFTVYAHQTRHAVSYPTALADFRKLMQMGIFTRRKEGAGYVYELQEGALEKLKRGG